METRIPRAFLVLVALALLAGCAKPPAKLVPISLAAPDSVYRQDPFTVGFTIKNTGGLPADPVLAVIVQDRGAVGNGAHQVHVDAGKCASQTWDVALPAGDYILYGTIDGARTTTERAVHVADQARPANGDSRGTINVGGGGPSTSPC